MIHVANDEKRSYFALNLDAAKRSGLSFSSKLLQLVEIVKE